MYDPVRNYTLKEFWQIVEESPNRKYEYVHGHIRLMSGGSPAHAQIAGNIITQLNIALRDEECNVYTSDAFVQMAEQFCYLPDVTVSCDPYDWTRKKALVAPTVVVEVLSPSTETIDKKEKLVAYKQYPTIQDILFVESRKHYIEHYNRSGPEDEWQLDIYEGDDDAINLASIEVTLQAHEIYRKVYLEMEEAEL